MRKIAACCIPTLLVLAWLVHAPGCGGTETGNPTDTGVGTPWSPSLGKNPAVQLLEAACSKIVECVDAIEEGDCEDRLAGRGEFGRGFGLRASEYPTFEDVIKAVEQGELGISEEAFAGCIHGIEMLTCQSDAFIGIHADDLADVGDLLATDGCPDVFVQTQRSMCPWRHSAIGRFASRKD